jgi:hypothetical protein
VLLCEDAYSICSYHEVSRFFHHLEYYTVQAGKPACVMPSLNAFVVNGLHYSNFLIISLIIEGIIMQPQVLDLYANEGSNL